MLEGGELLAASRRRRCRPVRATRRTVRRSCGGGSIRATATSSPVDVRRRGRRPGRRPARSRRRRGPARRSSGRRGRRACTSRGQDLERPGQQRVADEDRRSLRRTLCGRSAGRGAGRRRPSPAGRRAPASRRGSFRRRRRRAARRRSRRRRLRPPAAPAAAAAACRAPAGVANRLGQMRRGSRRRTACSGRAPRRSRGQPIGSASGGRVGSAVCKRGHVIAFRRDGKRAVVAGQWRMAHSTAHSKTAGADRLCRRRSACVCRLRRLYRWCGAGRGRPPFLPARRVPARRTAA